MANPLHRTLSSTQVSSWFGQGNGQLTNPSRIGSFSIEYVVIAGGGSGGFDIAGGGGAGGY